MLSMHANLYAMPADAAGGPQLELFGQLLATITHTAGGPPRFLATLPVTFEQMQASLAELPRSDLEPDGYFLLTGESASQDSAARFWRLNGHMHEYAPPGSEPMMHRLELHGECPSESLDAVLRTVGWPTTELAFELVREGVTLGEKEFRRWAEARHP